MGTLKYSVWSIKVPVLQTLISVSSPIEANGAMHELGSHLGLNHHDTIGMFKKRMESRTVDSTPTEFGGLDNKGHGTKPPLLWV